MSNSLKINMTDTVETPYFYVEHSCSMDPQDISANMGKAFNTVIQHMQSAGVSPAGPALTVYPIYDETRMTFRAGFVIASGDAEKASGEVKYDVTPAGNMLHTVHTGPYHKLRDTYNVLMKHLKSIGRMPSMPSWELYINEPGTVAEEELLTEIYIPTIKVEQSNAVVS